MARLIPFVALVVAAGYLLRKLGLVRGEAARDLTQIVFYVTLPPLIFTNLHGGEVDLSMLAMPAVAWAHALVGLALGWGLARLTRLPPRRAGAVMLAAAFGNTTYFGYPVIQGFYGTSHLTLAIFYDLLGATIAANTLGVFTAARFGTGELHPSRILGRLLRFPPIWALGLGLVLRGVALPPLVLELLSRLGEVTVPLIMLSIGLSLELRHWRTAWPVVLAVAVLRLAVLPLLVLVGVRLVGLPTAYQQTAVLQAAMPTMFFSLTLALLFDLEVRIVVNAIMVTTLASFATLPLWHRVLGL